jgi:toxin ParE1/3/4
MLCPDVPAHALACRSRRSCRHTAVHPKTWGKAQQDIYAEQFDRDLALIVENPEIGRARPELYAGCRSFRIQQHIVYYAILDDMIAVARVLHHRMDSRRYL